VAIQCDQGIREGVNAFMGRVTCAALAESQNRPAKDVSAVL
jgi:alanine dehydrogenase